MTQTSSTSKRRKHSREQKDLIKPFAPLCYVVVMESSASFESVLRATAAEEKCKKKTALQLFHAAYEHDPSKIEWKEEKSSGKWKVKLRYPRRNQPELWSSGMRYCGYFFGVGKAVRKDEAMEFAAVSFFFNVMQEILPHIRSGYDKDREFRFELKFLACIRILCFMRYCSQLVTKKSEKETRSC